MIVVDDGQLQTLPGAIEMYRAALGTDARRQRGHRRACAAACSRSRRRRRHLVRAAAQALLGLAAWSEGDLDSARSPRTPTPSPGCGASATSPTSSGCSIAMADIRSRRGDSATRSASTSRDCNSSPTTGQVRCGAAPTCTSASPRSCANATSATAAAEELRRGQALELFGTRQYPYRSLAVHAGLLLAEGDTAGCLALLEEAERVYDTDFSPAVRPIGARRARTYVRRATSTRRARWVRERGLSTDDDLRYVTEFEHITLAIVLLNDRARRTRAAAGGRDARPACWLRPRRAAGAAA